MKKRYKSILIYSGGEAIGDALYKLKFIRDVISALPILSPKLLNL